MTILNLLLKRLDQLKADPSPDRLEDLATVALVGALGVVALVALL
jgi:hypothetical protein